MHDLYDTGAMNTGDYANDSFIGRTPRPTDTKIKDRIKELVRRARSARRAGTQGQSEGRQRSLLPWRHARAVCGLHRTGRASLVFGAAQCRRRAPRSRARPGTRSQLRRREDGGRHAQLRVGHLPWSVKVAAAMAGLSGSTEKGLDVPARSRQERRRKRGRRQSRADPVPAPRAPVRRGARLHARSVGEVSQESSVPHRSRQPAARVGTPAGGRSRRIAKSGRTAGKGSTATCITNWQPGAWESCCAARRIWPALPPPTTWSTRRPTRIPTSCKKPTLPPEKCTTCSQKRDLAMKKYETVLAGNANTGPADQARRYIREAYRE